MTRLSCLFRHARRSALLLVTILAATTATAQIMDCNGNGFSDELEADADADGVIDACDNCLLIANAPQRDTDGDGFGNFCDPDLSNDGAVNFADLARFKSVFFGADPDADFDGDGSVNFNDLQIMVRHFFGKPGPGAGQVVEGLRPDQRADLAVTALEPAQVYPMPGERVPVAVRVRSAERESATDVATKTVVALYAGSLLIGQQELPILADTETVANFVWTPSDPGLQRLTAVVDPLGKLVERTRSDNIAEVEVVVARPPPPGTELAVTELLVISQPDRPYIPLLTVQNNGTTTVSVPLSVTANGIEFARRLIGPLAPGAAVQMTFDWPADEYIEHQQAVINPRWLGQEGVVFDNTRIVDFRDPVDLAVENLSITRLPPVAGEPERATVSFRVTNVGVNDVSVATTTRLSIAAIDTSNIDIPTPAVAAGKSVYVSRTVAGNDFSASVTADHPMLLNELDRQNNLSGRAYRATGSMHQWTTIGPGLITYDTGATGRIMTLAIDPGNANVIFAGSPTGSGGDRGGTGIWKTTNGGNSWQPVGDSLPSLSIRALAIDPNNSQRIYAATDEQGVFRSSDGGQTWVQTTSTNMNPRGNAATGLLVDPSNSARLFLRSNDGLYRSVNFGVDWTLVFDEGGGVTALQQDPSTPARLWVAVQSSDLSRTGIYQSGNSGDTWSATPLTGCPGDDLPNALSERTTVRLARSGSRMYASYRIDPPAEDTDGDGVNDQNICRSVTVYRTTGVGCVVGGVAQDVWERRWRTTNDSECGELWSGLYANPTHPDYLYLSGTRFWLSEDAGNSFAVKSGLQPHVDHHAFAAFPDDGTSIYLGSDGGVYRSDDRGRQGSWSFAGQGMAVTEFYDIADAPSAAGTVIGGTQDNGTLKTTGGFTWSHIRGGDGATVDIDPDTAQVMYSMGQYADSLRRSNNGGSSFPDDLALPVSATKCFNFPYHIHPATPSLLLASCQPGGEPGGLWRRAGSTWNVIFTPPSGNVAGQPSRSSAVDGTVDLYLAGTTNGEVHGGPGGANWRRIYQPGANAAVTDIEVDADDPETIFVTFNSSANGRVVRLRRQSDDPTEANTQSTDITANLPIGARPRALAVDRRNDQTVVLATTKGAYRGRSFDGGQTWTWDRYNFGLPGAVDISDLEVHPVTGVITAATYGRGAYEIETGTPIGSILAAEGRISLLRLHDVGTGFGPPGDTVEGEVIVKLDSRPANAFGFTLRTDTREAAHRGMLDVLRSAFNNDRRVRIEYQLTSIGNNFPVIRVIELFD